MIEVTGGPREADRWSGLSRIETVLDGSVQATGARSMRYGTVPLSRTFPAAHIQVHREVLWVAFW